MYRQQRSGGITTFLVVIFLGLVIGIGYLIYDSGFLTGQQAVIPTLPPPTAVPPTDAPTTVDDAAAPTPAGEITDGATFYAPAAQISGHVVETYLDGTSWDVSQLGRNIGHLQGTAWMPETGNIVLAGHVEMADGRLGIFAELDKLDIGDSILLSQNGEEWAYQVTQKFTTGPDDMTVVYPSESHRLTLITCTAYDFLSNQYDERFVVIADRVR